jgi:hypothetical protein
MLCRAVPCRAVQVCLEMEAHPDSFKPQLPPGYESAATVFHRWGCAKPAWDQQLDACSDGIYIHISCMSCAPVHLCSNSVPQVGVHKASLDQQRLGLKRQQPAKSWTAAAALNVGWLAQIG